MCVIITFKTNHPSATKRQIYENTLQMYHTDLKPEIWLYMDENVETNEYHTPLLRSLLASVQKKCPLNVPFIAYVNADILFEKKSLIQTLQSLKMHTHDLLIVGQRRNSMASNITQKNIKTVPSQLFQSDAQDYFIFSRISRALDTMPPYVMGRRAYDNGIVDWAYHNTDTLVDATRTIWAVHQTSEDGNYAGHSPLNQDKEHNINIKGIEYDHGSTLHARLETVSCPPQVCVRNRLVHITQELQNALRHHPCNGLPVFCNTMLDIEVGGFIAEEAHRSRLFLDRTQTLWLHNATILTNGDVWTHNQSFPSYGCSFEKTNHHAIPTQLAQHRRVVVITQYWGEGFFHTLIEGMPRLAQALHDYPQFFTSKQDIEIHVSQNAALGKVNDILRIAGFMRPAIHGDVRASELLLAPPTPCGGHTTGRHSARLRSLLLLALTPRPVSILVSKRSHGSSRSITNHESLMLAMTRLNVDVQEHTGQEPLLVQMQMFAGARIVMGPHGSGLANIITMSQENHVFEFLFVHGPEKANFCYATLALSLGLHYWSYYEPLAEWARPWAVNVDKVMDIVQTIVNFGKD